MSVVAQVTGLGGMSINQFFNRGGCLRSSTASPCCLDLKAIECRRIVRCRNHDSASGAKIFNGPGYERGWLSFTEKRETETVPGHDLSCSPGKLLRHEASIKAYDDEGLLRLLREVVGVGLGYPLDICEGKLARNDGPPSVSAKLYLGRRSAQAVVPPVMV